MSSLDASTGSTPCASAGSPPASEGEQARIESDGRADVPAGNWMSELLDQPRRAQIRNRAVDEDLGRALATDEHAAPRRDQQVPALDLGCVETRRAARATHFGDAKALASRHHRHLVHG